MLNFIRFIFNFVVVWLKMLRPGGARAIIAENIALRKQLIVLSHNRKRSPKLSTTDRFLFGFLTSMISVERLSKIAIVIKPATLLKFHHALVKRKYRELFSNTSRKKPGRKGPGDQLINAIIEMKQRNPRYGYRRIAMQINLAFDVNIDKDVVRRVLNNHYNNTPTTSNSRSKNRGTSAKPSI